MQRNSWPWVFWLGIVGFCAGAACQVVLLHDSFPVSTLTITESAGVYTVDDGTDQWELTESTLTLCSVDLEALTTPYVFEGAIVWLDMFIGEGWPPIAEGVDFLWANYTIESTTALSDYRVLAFIYEDDSYRRFNWQFGGTPPDDCSFLSGTIDRWDPLLVPPYEPDYFEGVLPIVGVVVERLDAGAGDYIFHDLRHVWYTTECYPDGPNCTHFVYDDFQCRWPPPPHTPPIPTECLEYSGRCSEDVTEDCVVDAECTGTCVYPYTQEQLDSVEPTHVVDPVGHCSVTTTQECGDDADCPASETCENIHPRHKVVVN